MVELLVLNLVVQTGLTSRQDCAEGRSSEANDQICRRRKTQWHRASAERPSLSLPLPPPAHPCDGRRRWLWHAAAGGSRRRVQGGLPDR
eukprot:SAG31_NODE_34259_length_335_cov_0.644068_1_plen_88_part_10